MDIKVIGLDFSSAPKKTKPIIVAVGCLKYLQNQLLTETNPNKRIEIMKKIELIASIYN